MFPTDLLRRLRNELPMWAVIAALDRDGPPSKVRDGRFVFLCPSCGEMLVAVNPRNNLAHCFGCGTNFNNIDLLLACDYDFRSAKHPMVGNPCSRSVFDPLKMSEIPGNFWVRGSQVQGSDVRPPLGIELKIQGKNILAIRTE